MAIQKVFYKRKLPKKFFFSKHMQVRSLAYGNEVHQEFKNWQKFFFEKRKAHSGEWVLSEQENIYGEPYTSDEKVMDKALAPLRLDGNLLELRDDKYVWVNGKKSMLYAGREVKAGALFYFQHNGKTIKGLAIISQISDGEDMQLRLFRWNHDALEAKCFAWTTIPSTMDASSHLLCFGKHIFMVHNSMLDYYYINIEENSLERVAIGEDGANETFAWCKYVNPSLITTGNGGVFWISENTVYGFLIGYPRQLLKIDSNFRENTLHICGEDNALCVYRKDKNTNHVNCTRYIQTETGSF